jgi:SAM-dependent methyltransferase
MEFLTADYWNNRYLQKQTGWDLGVVSSPIAAYINQLKDKDLRILIPGAGNSYEAVYLLEQGFKNITVIDFAEKALSNLKLRLNHIDEKCYHLIQEDFFNHEDEYDLILEQTFFCAINPELRKEYVNHTHRLLADNGKIVGLLFNRDFPFADPPFAGSKKEYLKLFESKFDIKLMEEAYNSIEARSGSELFVVLVKKVH